MTLTTPMMMTKQLKTTSSNFEKSLKFKLRPNMRSKESNSPPDTGTPLVRQEMGGGIVQTKTNFYNNSHGCLALLFRFYP